MKKRSALALLFYASVFVFVCILLSGGSRLIGHVDAATETQPQRMLGLISTRLTAAPAAASEDVCTLQIRQPKTKREMVSPSLTQDMTTPVLCDANGNVLGQRSYMREVYQVFSLGDGFV